MKRWSSFRASAAMHLTLARFVGHLSVLSIVAIALLLAPATTDQPLASSNAPARFNEATPSDRISENHFDHLSALASEAANHLVVPLANPPSNGMNPTCSSLRSSQAGYAHR